MSANQIARKVPTHEEWSRVKTGTEAYYLALQATAYVWGWQDATGKGSAETGDSIDFGHAYGVYAQDYKDGKYGSRHPIQDAWRAWVDTGDIATLHANDLRFRSTTA
ncbi:hypothetical protein [Nocardia sp. NPDC004260]